MKILYTLLALEKDTESIFGPLIGVIRTYKIDSTHSHVSVVSVCWMDSLRGENLGEAVKDLHIVKLVTLSWRASRYVYLFVCIPLSLFLRDERCIESIQCLQTFVSLLHTLTGKIDCVSIAARVFWWYCLYSQCPLASKMSDNGISFRFLFPLLDCMNLWLINKQGLSTWYSYSK